ncbi:MAG: 16S rRNA (uracil(1498)-N(3))-methyltransferase, partial [Muribaculum sp.]|nr:16S rRNA (uracil(1498)-N(3))-methyltransferase [Muribaculum sp.]
MIQYFAPDIATTLTLPEDEARHCIRVCRTPAGGTATVVDGCGNRYTVRLLSDDPRHPDVEIIESETVAPQWNGKIIVGVAPTKNIDRIEWLLEKLTEVGIDRFVPVLCDHSERKVVKTDRLMRIAISAMKQSLKATLPEISEMTGIRQFINDTADVAQRFIAYCDDNIPRRLLAQVFVPGDSDVAVLIGPEGDFSPREVKMALDAGFVPVSLGPCRLRTET